MEEEQWKPVFGYEDQYEVSNLGRVKRTVDGPRTYAGHILSPRTHPSGYKVVKLRSRSHRVHRLVATAFYGPSNLLVRHLDGDPSNNRLENLRFGTHAENYADALRHGDVNPFRAEPVCVHGHELTDENSKLKKLPSGNICRLCRICIRASNKRSRDRIRRASLDRDSQQSSGPV